MKNLILVVLVLAVVGSVIYAPGGHVSATEQSPVIKAKVNVLQTDPDPVSEEIVRPLAELLMTDFLVGTERAKRIVTFRLGVPVHGRRRLVLAREPPSYYSNQREGIREVSGEVKL